MTPGRRSRSQPTRRDQILIFVIEYAADHAGNSPSLGEIALAFGFSRQTAYIHILKLSIERRAEYRDNKLCLIGAEFIPPVTALS